MLRISICESVKDRTLEPTQSSHAPSTPGWCKLKTIVYHEQDEPRELEDVNVFAMTFLNACAEQTSPELASPSSHMHVELHVGERIASQRRKLETRR